MARKPKEQTPAEIANEFAKGLINAAEMFAPIRDAVNGYKQSYIADGWSEGAAEAMAVQYHMVLCNGFLGGIGATNEQG